MAKSKKHDYDKKRKDFLDMLTSVDREELTEFVKQKGREPKLIKPFICLNNH